jgi:hypothetical protein
MSEHFALLGVILMSVVMPSVHHAKCRGAYLSRQIEGENGEIENADAGDDEVDHEEERLPPDLQVEVNI